MESRLEMHGLARIFDPMRRAWRWPVPQGLEERRRASAQMVVLFALLFGMVGLGYTLFTISVGAQAIAVVTAATSLLMFSAPWIMHRTHSLSAGVHVILLGGWVSVSTIAAMSGGLEAPVIAWYALVPAAAIFVDGRGSGRIWLGVCVATVLVFAALDLADVLPPEPPTDTLVVRRALALVVLVGLMAMMMFFYDGTHRTLIAELHQLNVVGARTRAEVELKNDQLSAAHTELANAHAALGEAHAALGAAHSRGAREAEKQRRLSLELRQAQKLEAVGRLAAGVAHELNTPLQFVSDSMSFVDESVRDVLAVLGRYRAAIASTVPAEMGACVLAELDRIDRAADLVFLTEKTPEAISLANQGVTRMATIVRAMKEFAYADVAELVPLDLNQAIHNTLIISKAEYRGCADVETDLEDLPAIECRAGEVSQVLLNLIVNAAHAIEERVRGSDERGTIRVRSTQVDGGVEVTVSDDGCGIPDSIRHRLFDPFFTTKAVGKGTGQGLAISRHVIVDKHQGQLDFTTELGTGSTFRVWLPLHVTGPKPLPEAEMS